MLTSDADSLQGQGAGSRAQRFYDSMRHLASDVLPVIGAGVAAGCGAPRAEDLVLALREAAADTDDATSDLYALADKLEERFGTEWVQQVIAVRTEAASLHHSPAMLALTLVPSRVVLTTNYDQSVEVAAAMHGLLPISLLPSDLPELARAPGPNEFFVLHVHGIATRPESIVLTRKSYDSALDDEALALAIRSMAVGHRLVFFGHSLGEQEAHLRRDIKRVGQLFDAGAGHYLVHSDGDIHDPVKFEAETGVRPVGLPNENGDFSFVVQVAQLLIPRPVTPAGALVPMSTYATDVAYEPLPVAPGKEVADETSRSIWHYGRYFGKAPLELQQLDDPRILLVGEPGCGKSQTMLHLLASDPKSAIYARLGACHPLRGGESLESVFADWMSHGVSATGQVPAVTTATIVDGSFTFLLDGLDEVRSDLRPNVIDTIVELAERHPQHRWIVSARRVPEIRSGGLAGFAEYELMPCREWLHAYARQRGVEPERLDEAVAKVAGLGDLIHIPLFAAVAVSRALDNTPMPSSALDLVLSFVSEGMATEQGRLRHDLALIDAWLDRLALEMLATDQDALDRQCAAAEHLRGAVDDDVTTDRLTTRALVVEQSGQVRFATRTVRDARAARALTNHPDGADELRRLAVVRLGGQVQLRPQWQYTVDLLLADDHNRWAPVLVSADPLAVSRAVAPDATDAARSAAVRSIWEWYETHHLHIPRTTECQLVSDLDALVALCRNGFPIDVYRTVCDAVTQGDWIARGNAALVLGYTGKSDSLEPYLDELLDHEESTVRRRAVEAIEALKLNGYAHKLAQRALSDTDDLARRAEVNAAILLATDDELPEIIANIGPRLRRDAQLSIDHRWSIEQQLAHQLTIGEPDHELLEHLAQSDDSWSAADVEALGEIWARAAVPHMPVAVRNVLGAHPDRALGGWFRSTRGPADVFNVWFLLTAIEDENALRSLASGNPAAELLVEDYLAQRQTPGKTPMAPTPATAPTRLRVSLTTLISNGDIDSILARRPPPREEIENLPARARGALAQVIEDRWRGDAPLSNIRRTNDRHWDQTTQYAFPLLEWAAALSLGIGQDDWIRAVNLGLGTLLEFRSWLADCFQTSWMPGVALAAGSLNIDGLAAVLEAENPMSDVEASALTEQCVQLAQPDPIAADNLIRACAARLADGSHESPLRRLADAVPGDDVDAALLALPAGDADAQRRILDRFLSAGCPEFALGIGAPPWVKLLRQQTSSSAIAESVRIMLRRGDEPHEIAALLRALNRCGGEGALLVYDSLKADTGIQNATFLWYQQQECLHGLIALTPVSDE